MFLPSISVPRWWKLYNMNMSISNDIYVSFGMLYGLPRAFCVYNLCGFIPWTVWRFSDDISSPFRCRMLALNLEDSSPNFSYWQKCLVAYQAGIWIDGISICLLVHLYVCMFISIFVCPLVHLYIHCYACTSISRSASIIINNILGLHPYQIDWEHQFSSDFFYRLDIFTINVC